jgi:pyruvate kinase
VVGASPSQGVLQQLALDWAVVPLQLEESSTVEEQWAKAIEAVSRAGLAGPGDRVVITSGTRMNRPGSTNTILVQAL